MALERFPSAEAPPGSRIRTSRGSAAHAVWAVEERLASAERELRVQFIRIAQLQAELNVLQAALRRPPDALRTLDRIG